ncbi:MAG: hypothetical protein K5872_19390 [Rhizobiaceae bacterium]|nr:hypothetical protein [Rhizobiaceae bacterium]MCV0408387.1 hypothetical protein [Rhizobiaceae bacterium]
MNGTPHHKPPESVRREPGLQEKSQRASSEGRARREARQDAEVSFTGLPKRDWHRVAPAEHAGEIDDEAEALARNLKD